MVKKYTESALKLIGSFTLFKQFFYEELTKRPYTINQPMSRESRQITMAKELTKVQRGITKHLLINIPPGCGKSTELALFMAWSYAKYPDSNFLYISHTKSLAEKHTHTVKKIIELPAFRKLFHVELRKDSTAKGSFTTTAGGTTMAFGSGGAIVGQDAGLPNLDRFSGALIMDDMHKPDEVHSDVVRDGVISNYQETILSRLRGPNVPIIAIGQRLHELDIFEHLLSGKDGHEWTVIDLQALDSSGNNLCEDVITTKELLIKKETNPYTFYSQYQQRPTPSHQSSDGATNQH